MAEFAWTPFAEDSQPIPGRRLATGEELERQISEEMRCLFPDGWLEGRATAENEENNG